MRLAYLYYKNYYLSSVSIETSTSTYSYYKPLNSVDFKTPQPPPSTKHGNITVRVTISFTSEAKGSFPQSVILDFGEAPFLVVKLHVDVQSGTFLEKLKKERNKLKMDWKLWDKTSMKIVRFEPRPPNYALDDQLLKKYPLPERPEVIYTDQLQDEGKGLNPNNYNRVMHSLLFVEETFMQKEIGRWVTQLLL